jgi:hypothetical protein
VQRLSGVQAVRWSGRGTVGATTWVKGSSTCTENNFKYAIRITIDTAAKFTFGVVDTGGKFATTINNTSDIGGKFAAGDVDTGGAP